MTVPRMNPHAELDDLYRTRTLNPPRSGSTESYFAGIPVAVILTGIALWRSQAMPRWLPVLFVVALLAGALAPPGVVSVPLSLPFVIVMMLLARRIWDTAPER